jgi:hemolysin activation/secretion protein
LRSPFNTHPIILISGQRGALYALAFIDRYETCHSAHRNCSACEGNHGNRGMFAGQSPHMNLMAISARFSITPTQVSRRIGRAPVCHRFAITILVCFLAAGPALAAQELGGAVIQNSSVYGSSELFEVYRHHLGSPVTEQTATLIAEALQRKYLEDGYSRPGYAISDRGTASGIVRIRLVEASIANVAINGDAGPYRKKLEELVADLPSDQSLRPQEIREALRSARRLPGLEVNVAAEPDGQQAGRYVLAVDSAYRPFEGSVKLSNRGTREIDRDILFARVVANGMFGHEIAGGLFVTSAKDSANYKGGGFFANSAVDSRGTSVQLQGAVTALQYDVQGVRVNQDRSRSVFRLSYPLLRQSARDLSIWGGLVTEDLDIAFNGLISREERLRSLETGSTLTWRQDDRQHLLSIEFEQGMNGLGSRIDNVNVPDNQPQPDFSIARLRYVRLATINDLWTWRLDSYAQTSPHLLPSIKRFKVGGGRIGRGFEAAAISGDRGVGGKAELKRRIANGVSWLERADLYGFYDLGSAWRNDVSGRESAASTGIGISLRDERVSGYLEVAKPLTHADADGRKDTGIFAEVSYRF